MQPAVTLEALDGGDPLACRRRERDAARPHRAPVEQHRAGAALPFAAAVLGAGQLQPIAQHGEQALVGRRLDPALRAVDVDQRVDVDRPP
jgi:hypothetical protein